MSNQLLPWNAIFQRAVLNTTKRCGIFTLGFVSLLLSASMVMADPSSEPTVSPPMVDPELSVAKTVKEQGSARVIILLQVEEEVSQTRSSKQALATKRQNIKKTGEKFLDGMRKKVLDGLVSGKVPFDAANANPDSQVKTMLTEFPIVVMTVDSFLLEVVNSLPMVVYVGLDRLFYPTLSDSIPLIGADAAWQKGYTGGCQAVAVLDTGVDKDHPDLKGKVIAEACFSSNNTNTTSLCPNNLNSEIGPGTASFQCGVNDRCRHGTHVAGIAAANGDVEGVAKNGNIVAVQVFHRNIQSGKLSAWLSDIILALEHVLQLHQDGKTIAAVNMSLGGGRFSNFCDASFPSMKTVIDDLRAAGIATIVASGNNGFLDALSVPACISSAISVGATSKSDAVANFSNSAYFLDLLAPGVSINSTIPGGGHASFNGTSMAAPHVAGAWAVLKAAKPTATVTDILTVLQTTGVSILDTKSGINTDRIQVDAALTALGPEVGILYGVHDEGLNNSHFFTIDPNNSFQVAALGAGCPGCDIEGLDMHPQTCELYASAGDDTQKPGHLYLVSKNGGLTDLGPTGFQEVDALSFNPDTGVLWGWAQDAGLLRFDNLPAATATLVAPVSNWEVEDITWDMAGTTLYGVRNLHGSPDPDSGPDPDLGVQLLSYDGISPPGPVCQSLVNSMMEIEALDTLPNDDLIFGFHDRNDLVIGALNVGSCEIVDQVEISSTPYNDVEGIAWPSQ